MAEVEVIRWPWWMAPARVIGRIRPTLLATAQSDAAVLARLPRIVGSVLIPLTVVSLAAGFAALHAFSVGFEPALPLNWLRFHMDNIYTEVPLFIIAASVIGALSPSAAVLFVLSFLALDFGAAAMHPEELHMSVIRPYPIVGRLIAYWLLWLLAVEVPVLGRVMALSVRRVAGNRLAVAALCGVVTGGLTLLWCHGAAALLRPVYLWSDIGGPYAEGFIPIQTVGNVFALVAGATAFAVALARGPGQLVHPVARRVDDPQRPPGIRGTAIAVARQLIVAALLTVGLAGLILTWLDAAVVFLALAGARPLARLIAERSPIGAITERLTPLARLAVAMVLVFGVSFFLVYAPVLRSVSEFFSVIVVFAVGLFVIELVTAPRSSRSDVRPSATAVAAVGALMGLGLLALNGLAPSPVFADNGASLQDLWALFDIAVFAGFATPIIVWVAYETRPTDPPLLVDAPTAAFTEKPRGFPFGGDFADLDFGPSDHEHPAPPAPPRAPDPQSNDPVPFDESADSLKNL